MLKSKTTQKHNVGVSESSQVVVKEARGGWTRETYLVAVMFIVLMVLFPIWLSGLVDLLINL